jgi:integrase
MSKISKLTKRAIDSVELTGKEQFVWDGSMEGFGLRITAKGKKTFCIQYRRYGRTRRMKIGTVGKITVEEARAIAREQFVIVATGGNPAQDRKMDLVAPTVETLAERFIRDHVVHHCKPSTQKEYRRSLNIFVNPKIGKYRVEDVTRADIDKIHQSMHDKPYQANRTLGVMSKMFNMAELWGMRLDGSNPCRLIRKYKEFARERFLNPIEITKLHKVLNEAEADGTETKSAVATFRLLLLTGCRLGEIQTLQWKFIDGTYITLPDSKTGRRRIPITEPIQAVLNDIERQDKNPYVIYGKVEGNYLTDLQHPWRRIRERADLEGVRIHDLRHTYASRAIAKGMSIPMVGKLLGHTQVQTTARYAHLADDQVKEAAELVSADIGFG